MKVTLLIGIIEKTIIGIRLGEMLMMMGSLFFRSKTREDRNKQQMNHGEMAKKLCSGENGFFELLEYPYSIQEELLYCFSAYNSPELQSMALRVAWRRAQNIDFEKECSINLLKMGLESSNPMVWQEALAGVSALDIKSLKEWYSLHKNNISNEKSDWIKDALA